MHDPMHTKKAGKYEISKSNFCWPSINIIGFGMKNNGCDSSLPTSIATPDTTFYCLIDGARPPQPSDRSAAGTLPTRATRHCDAVTSASAFGWYIFSPIDFMLLWDGEQIFWQWGRKTNWIPLKVAQYPGMSSLFEKYAPQNIKKYSPPFLTVLPESGVIQIWSGIFARTAPGWSLLIRSPANLPNLPGCTYYEGIVETDVWFGPLFINIRITRTNYPIRISTDLPLFQAQPLPRVAYNSKTMNSLSCFCSLESLTVKDWRDYYNTLVVPNKDPDRGQGGYAVAARRRRKGECPITSIADSH